MPKKTIEELLHEFEVYTLSYDGYPIPESKKAKEKARKAIVKAFRKLESKQ